MLPGKITLPAAPQGGRSLYHLLLPSLFSLEHLLPRFPAAVGIVYMHAHTCPEIPSCREDLMLPHIFRFAAAKTFSLGEHPCPKNPNIGLRSL